MKHQISSVAITLLFFASISWAVDPAGPVKFRTHIIDENMGGVYQAFVTDINGDGRPDVIPKIIPGRPVAYWYENPSWERHLLMKDVKSFWYDSADLSLDGIPELIVAADFSRDPASHPEGGIYTLKSGKDPTKPWNVSRFDKVPMAHRLLLSDANGDGKPEIIIAPLVGEDSSLPDYPGDTPLIYYRIGELERYYIKQDFDGVVHGMTSTAWDESPRQMILTAGFEGIWWHRAAASKDPEGTLSWSSGRLVPGASSEQRALRGTSDLRVGKLPGGQRFITAFEPFHGPQLVVYTNKDPEALQGWQRKVIDDSYEFSHALATADFNGDGIDEIVGGDRAKGGDTFIYYAEDESGKNWHRVDLDTKDMAASDCTARDMNGDQRVDIVCGSQQNTKLKWYENLGEL